MRYQVEESPRTYRQCPSRHFRISTDCLRYDLRRYGGGVTEFDGFGVELVHVRSRQANAHWQIMTPGPSIMEILKVVAQPWLVGQAAEHWRRSRSHCAR